ncbi:hypothetical protein LX64_04216 [Chitinophaga skermanii]|uniref:Uncharacterized protein n=1 Tax=Chitinophaga skermanii TaxID=331697 RepID=A0A327Q7M5_9BACT|nr:hypothetical protein [Chitinophaga skermanii]RAJ00509.1 hypothetical protein LX64_04216 [Chitinophaga skermanii]
MKTKIISTAIVGALFLFCNTSHAQDISFDSKGFKEKNLKTYIEANIEIYVDSINNAFYKSEIPAFLLDTQLDYKFRSLWISPHLALSIRKQIINRVSNCHPLRLILESKEPLYKKQPLREDVTLPYGNKSIYDFVKERLYQLDCLSK